MTRLRLSMKLPDVPKPKQLKSLRHKISKKEVEEYYSDEGIEKIEEEN